MTNLHDYIRDIPDFPKPGIVFKDITPLLAHHGAFQACIEQFAHSIEGVPCDAVVGIESRGFLFGTALALAKGVGFIPVRKPGKLPHDVVRQEYTLEYGTDTVEMHRDAIAPGQSVVIIDDLIATGGTAGATVELIEQVGGRVAAMRFLISLDFLPWRDRLGDHDASALLTFS